MKRNKQSELAAVSLTNKDSELTQTSSRESAETPRKKFAKSTGFVVK
jgi:hypothetical protein